MTINCEVKKSIEDLVENLNISGGGGYTIEYCKSPYEGGTIIKGIIPVIRFTSDGTLGITLNTTDLEMPAIQYYNKLRSERLKSEHVINFEDKNIVFNSVDDLLLYSASVLQRKIDKKEYKNHDQLIEMQDEILNITDRISKPLDSSEISNKVQSVLNDQYTKFKDSWGER